MKEMKKSEVAESEEERRILLLSELTNHVGQHNAIGMANLYEAVFNRPWDNRINDTRSLRTLITKLRDQGVAICSVSDCNGGGYYLAAVGSETDDYLRRQKIRALKILTRNARIKKTNLPNYLGQIKIEMESVTTNGEKNCG